MVATRKGAVFIFSRPNKGKLMRGGAEHLFRVCDHEYPTLTVGRGVDPYGTGGTCPPIFMKGGGQGDGTSMVMSPQYVRSDVV